MAIKPKNILNTSLRWLAQATDSTRIGCRPNSSAITSARPALPVIAFRSKNSRAQLAAWNPVIVRWTAPEVAPNNSASMSEFLINWKKLGWTHGHQIKNFHLQKQSRINHRRSQRYTETNEFLSRHCSSLGPLNYSNLTSGPLIYLKYQSKGQLSTASIMPKSSSSVYLCDPLWWIISFVSLPLIQTLCP